MRRPSFGQPMVAVVYWIALLSLVNAFTIEERAHWAFQHIAEVVPPSGSEPNPIDRFLERDSDDPWGMEAEPRDLLRRAYFDLTGLPPSKDEVAMIEENPEAYDSQLESLLASTAYGERAARIWLDLVRYADSDGYKADVYRPHAWKYRDYVIRAFNEDKGYDRFLQEQLAGDEMFPESADAWVATGFLRLWPYEDNQIDVRRQWTAIMEDITDVTSEAVMALGLKCAKCHDHKYDPIPQADYYRFEAFFAGILPKTDASLCPPSLTKAYEEELKPWLEATATIRGEMDALLEQPNKNRYAAVYEKFPEYLQEIFDKDAREQSPFERQMVHMGMMQVDNKGGDLKLKGKLDEAYSALEKSLKTFDYLRPKALPIVMGVVDVGEEAPPVRFGKPGAETEVGPGFLSIIEEAPPRITPVSGSSGRRKALAEWLTRPGHPLTSRVIVNRVWQQHFGVGLVATANDFGKQGSLPSDPELLDWLAGWFAENEWSLKKLHKLIMTSRAYRQAASDSLATPMRRRTTRLESEQLRDALLTVTGELSDQLGGPAVDGDVPRRSIYVKQIRNQQDELLKSFDGADMFNSCARREVTNTPLQSLMLLNGEWILKRAEVLADQLSRDCGCDEAFLRAAFHRVLARDPKPSELSSMLAFLGEAPDSGRFDICHVLLNTNEFLYID